MNLKPYKTEADYCAALKRLEDIFDAKQINQHYAI